jgi:hypothetical protein
MIRILNSGRLPEVEKEGAMKILKTKHPSRADSGGFHARRWIAGVVVLMLVSGVCWWVLRQTVLPPSAPLAPVESAHLQEGDETENPGAEQGPLHVAGAADGTLGDEEERCTSECLRRAAADFDGDGDVEILCAREAWVKMDQCRTPYRELIVDLFKDDRCVLRQHFDSGVFHEERFFLAWDLDGDGQAELITRLKLSPDCSGCVAYRIYSYIEDSFSGMLNLFGVSPKSSQVKQVLLNYFDILKHVDRLYRLETSRENPCGYGEEPSSCVVGHPWLLDSDGDGRLEVVLLLEPPTDDYFLKPRFYRLLVMELEGKGNRGPHRFYPLEMGGGGGFISLLGFLRTRDGRVHALVNFAHPGTSTAYPILNVFEVKGTSVKPISKLYGFYEHVIPDRLWDVNQDGNTEIIHVPFDYWPPGKSHAEVVPYYEIVEYKGGKYVPAGPGINDLAIIGDEEDFEGREK